MSIQMVVEKDTPCEHFHAGAGGIGYTFHVPAAGCGQGYTLQVHAAIVEARDTLFTSMLLVVERDG